MEAKAYLVQFRVFPLWALLSIGIGVLLAHVSISDLDYSYGAALKLSAACLSIGLLAPVLLGAIHHPASLLRAESVLSAGLVYWILLDVLQGLGWFGGLPRFAIVESFYAIALFAVGLWLGSSDLLRVPRTRITLPKWELTPGVVFYLVLGTFAAGAARAALGCSFSPGCLVESLYVPWNETPWRNLDIPGFNSFLVQAGRLGLVTMSLSAVLYHLERRMSWRVVVSITLSVLMFLFFFQSGSRRQVGVMVLATGLIWVLMHTRVKAGHMGRLALLGVILLVALEAMFSWRNIGIAAAISGDVPITGRDEHTLITVDKNFYYMTHAIARVPERHPYSPSDLVFALTVSVPRSVWPGKPKAHSINLPALIGERRSAKFNWSCSIVCDFYLMGGMVAVAIGGFVYGILAKLCNRLLLQPPSTRSRVFYGMSLMILFIGIRNVRDATGGVLLLLGLLAIFLFIRHFTAGVTRARITVGEKSQKSE